MSNSKNGRSSKLLAVVSADWHLRKNAWARHPELSGDAYYSLRQIIDLCLENRVPLIAAGDLFDLDSPDSHSVWEAMVAMERMADAQLPVFYVQGQHEMTRDRPWLGLHRWPYHIHEQQVSLGRNMQLYGLDFRRAEQIQEALDSIPEGTDVLVCHQVWKDFMGDMVSSATCASYEVPRVRMIITGDFHQTLTLRAVGKDGQDVLMVSPGSTCLQALREPADKYVFLLHSDGQLERTPIKTRPYYVETLSSRVDWDAWAEHVRSTCVPGSSLPASITKPILQVCYSDELPDAYDNIRRVVGGSGAYHLFLTPLKRGRSREESSGVAHVEDRKEIIKAGLEGCLPRVCDEGSAAFTVSRRLLRSREPGAELTQMEGEILQGQEAGR